MEPGTLVQDGPRRADRPTPATARAALAGLLRGYVALCVVLVPIGLGVTRLAVLDPVRSADRSISASVVAARSHGWNIASAWVTGSLDTFGAIATAVVLSVAIWLRWHDRMWTLLPLGLGLELLVFLTVSEIVGRDRPAVTKLGSTPSTQSLPSGHAAAAAVIWVGAAVVLHEQQARRPLRWVVNVAALFMPLAVAAARVYRGMHYTSDVLVGLAMGVMVVFVVLHTLRRLPMAGSSDGSGPWRR